MFYKPLVSTNVYKEFNQIFDVLIAFMEKQDDDLLDVHIANF